MQPLVWRGASVAQATIRQATATAINRRILAPISSSPRQGRVRAAPAGGGSSGAMLPVGPVRRGRAIHSAAPDMVQLLLPRPGERSTPVVPGNAGHSSHGRARCNRTGTQTRNVMPDATRRATPFGNARADLHPRGSRETRDRFRSV